MLTIYERKNLILTHEILGTPDPGPIYSHLGAASTLLELRSILERQTGFVGAAVRLEKVIYTGKEGKTDAGCPLAKWVSSLRESSLLLLLVLLVE